MKLDFQWDPTSFLNRQASQLHICGRGIDFRTPDNKLLLVWSWLCWSIQCFISFSSTSMSWKSNHKHILDYIPRNVAIRSSLVIVLLFRMHRSKPSFLYLTFYQNSKELRLAHLHISLKFHEYKMSNCANVYSYLNGKNLSVYIFLGCLFDNILFLFLLNFFQI